MKCIMIKAKDCLRFIQVIIIISVMLTIARRMLRVMSDDNGSQQTLIVIDDFVRLQSMTVNHPKGRKSKRGNAWEIEPGTI